MEELFVNLKDEFRKRTVSSIFFIIILLYCFFYKGDYTCLYAISLYIFSIIFVASYKTMIDHK